MPAKPSHVLFEAARAGDVERVRQLLAGRKKPDERNPDAVIFGNNYVAIRRGTPLMAAVAEGHLDAARALLEAGADPTIVDDNGYCAVHLSAMLGKTDILPLLAANPAWLTVRDRNKDTPLHQALKADRFETARRLIELDADPNLPGSNGDTPLLVALQSWVIATRPTRPGDREQLAQVLNVSVASLEARDRKKIEQLEVLLRALLEAGSDVNRRNDYDFTPLHIAADADRPDALEWLIARGADVNVPDVHGFTPLFRAGSHSGNVRALLAAGAAVDAQTPEGETPLTRAAECNWPEVVTLLAGAGADVRHQTQAGKSALSLAADSGHREVFELLVRLGAADESSGSGAILNNEALRRAAEAKDIAEVRRLLAAGADPNAPGDGKEPALWLAAAAGDESIVSELLAAHADPNIMWHYGQTPLHVAAERGDAGIVRRLIDAGGKVEVAADRGREGYDPWTPLMAACEAGDSESVRLLLEGGAQLAARTRSGLTPLLIAALNRHASIVKALRERGGKVAGLALHLLEPLEFPARIKAPAFRQAVDDLAALCGVKARPSRDFPFGAAFNLSRTPAVKDQLGTRSNSLDRQNALRRAIHQLIDRVRADYLARGFLVLYYASLPGDRLVLLPTTNPFAAVAALGPHPGGPLGILKRLDQLARAHRWQLRGASYDTLLLEFPAKMADPDDLARQLIRFGSDERSVLDGAGDAHSSRTQLAHDLTRPAAIVRLWWD